MTAGTNITEIASASRPWANAAVLGTVYCIASAVAYAIMGICLRAVSTNCDPVWVNCVQAMVGTVAALAYLLVMSARGKSNWPPVAIAGALMILGGITQLGGATYQWAIGAIGLAICNPLQMGVTLAVSAVLGLLVMGEAISRRGILAIFVLSIAVVCLSMGADAASAQMAEDVLAAEALAPNDSPLASSGSSTANYNALIGSLGVAAAAASGIAFAILTVGIRKVATGATAAAAIVFYINLMGIVVLGPWSLQRLGWSGLLATPPVDLAIMLGVGASNLIAFLLLTKGLQLTPVVRTNIIVNSLTLVLSVLAGVVMFGEPRSYGLIAGLILSLTGVAIIGFAESEQSQTPIDSSLGIHDGAIAHTNASVSEGTQVGLA
jgi:drug/metabolite transporter, DME family